MDEKITITQEQLDRINQLFGSLPYGGGLVALAEDFNAGDIIIVNLERLTATLQYVSERYTILEAELSEYREAVRGLNALKKLMGS